ncbi:hypothetical protein NDU88_005944 [Pleurodeles waltl]|uniref:Uncharacterized protein n=1 Tax=Pleurodeles waltl TaxID=8319 RepID=A0AAV7WCV4_PLEWA|nr:hypothetical protein NDU88_005944 [Pleurodeles waltl]
MWRARPGRTRPRGRYRCRGISRKLEVGQRSWFQGVWKKRGIFLLPTRASPEESEALVREKDDRWNVRVPRKAGARRPRSTASVEDPRWRNKEDGCRRGGTSGAQDESQRRNTMREGVEEQEPGGPGEEELRGYPEEVMGRGEKDKGRSNPGVIAEGNPSRSGDENQHDEEEMWSEDWWCPPLPFTTPVPATTHG